MTYFCDLAYVAVTSFLGNLKVARSNSTDILDIPTLISGQSATFPSGSELVFIKPICATDRFKSRLFQTLFTDPLLASTRVLHWQYEPPCGFSLGVGTNYINNEILTTCLTHNLKVISDRQLQNHSRKSKRIGEILLFKTIYFLSKNWSFWENSPNTDILGSICRNGKNWF